MTAAEEGVLLLCCRLGDETVKPLTMAQFRGLGQTVRASSMDGDALKELCPSDLVRLGIQEEQAARITALLDRTERLHRYLSYADRRGIAAITRISPAYPKRIAEKLRLSCPPVLFAMGPHALLDQPSVAVVGSRKLLPENEAFAKAVGRQAAAEGLVLVSGNASGADQTAQQACLDAGGSCVVFVADRLMDRHPHERILYISEDGYDLPFSAARALHRNGLIHMQGDKVIAAQCTYGKGGTWEGSLENLKHGWSPLFVFADGSDGSNALLEHGAAGISQLSTISELTPSQMSLF